MSEWYRLKKGCVPDGVIYKLMDYFERFDDIFIQNEEFLKKRLNISEDIYSRLYNSKEISIEDDMEVLRQRKIKLISFKDDIFPECLKNISSPPLFLYAKGKLEFPENSIGVVGTRRMTGYGKSAAEKMVKELVERGVTIISGLAEGIDGIAHAKTLQCKGYTIAVVGSGLDKIYPDSNKRLWERISEEGTLISEYPPGTEPHQWNFPQRNRIIVGLSRGILVAESYISGGSLITAKLALENNRDVFAIPGFISYPSFEGCNELIKKSEAKLITCADDILVEYGWDGIKPAESKIDLVLNENEKLLYNKLIHEKNVDELILDTKLRGTDVLVILTEMEIKGFVKSVSGGKYRRNEL